jgi:hypothetical protein
MPRLAVQWKASDCRSQAFYHPDEERLVVCVNRTGTFAAFVDGGPVSFDLDSEGHLLGITVEAARETWQVIPDLMAPRIGIPATVRFLDAPTEVGGVQLLTDPDHVMLRVELSPAKPVHVLQPCDGLLFDVGEKGELLAAWVQSIHEDYGSRQQRAWRAAQTS